MKYQRFLTCVLQISVFLVTNCVVDSARILVVVPTPSISHIVIYQPVIRELSLRGHQVVAIIPNPLKDPALTNLTEIDVHDISYEVWRKKNFLGESGTQKITAFDQFVMFHTAFRPIVEAQLSHPDVQALIKNPEEHFDLVIAEWIFYLGTYAFKERFNCPLVGIISLGLFASGYDTVGSPSHPAYNVDFMELAGYLTFWQRLENLWYYVQCKYFYNTVIIPEYNEMVAKYFGSGISDVGDIARSVELLLVNTNPIFHVTRPIVPAIIEIGGIHKKLRKPLPQDIKTILDKAKSGVVYFSLGSNVNTTAFGADVLQTVINTFQKLPYTFICKWANAGIVLPKNMIGGTWWPQQDILDHPNVKLFITQGGLQSTEETIRSQVPILGIPFGGDQIHNVDRIVHLGIGKRILVEEINEQSLTQAIEEIIKDPTYKRNIVKVSGLLWDQPMPPLERAIWWIEYVLRHGGASNLRSPLVDMSWVQFLMIDILAFLLILVVVTLAVTVQIIRTICRLLRPKTYKDKSA